MITTQHVFFNMFCYGLWYGSRYNTNLAS